jgi:ADP-ribosylglycohydrolase
MEMLTRARGALYGLAIGDALGMPTQMLSRAEIVRRWGPLLRGFEPAPPGHPIAGGMPAGAVTDDTEQAVLLARLLIKGRGTIDPHELAAALTEWERAMADRTVMASSVTHNTGVALAGAAAVAAAVSAGVSGATVAEATALGIQAAGIAACRGHWVAGADVAARIEWATSLVAGQDQEVAANLVYRIVGTSLATQESVPAAFAVLAAVPADPWRACRMAASLGGDSDTIAAMTGAIAGACHGAGSFPPAAIAAIDAQGLGLAALAGELLALRDRCGSEAP